MAKGDAKALTTIAVQRMRPPPTGRKETFDAKVPGLFLRVTKTGNKSWGLDFRINGKRERLMLGSYPVVGLDDARTAAMDALRAVAETPFQVGAKGITSLVAAAVLPATPAAGTRGG